MSKVTIAIASYNREQYLKECLESIRNQTFKDFEVIIFDNGSRFDIQALISDFGDIKIILEQESENIGQILNFIKIYTYNYLSNYIIVFHDDDTMHPKLLEAEVSALDAEPELQWAGASFAFVTNAFAMNNFPTLNFIGKQKVVDRGELTREILLGFPLCFDSVMYRKGVFGDDLDLVKRFSKWSDRPQVITWAGSGKVALINLPLVNFRLHDHQDSAQKVDVESYIVYAKNLFQFYKENLPQPLSRADKNLWYRHTTNHLILFSAQNSSTIKEFLGLLNSFRPEYFSWKYLRPKGVYYIIKSLLGL